MLNVLRVEAASNQEPESDSTFKSFTIYTADGKKIITISCDIEQLIRVPLLMSAFFLALWSKYPHILKEVKDNNALEKALDKDVLKKLSREDLSALITCGAS